MIHRFEEWIHKNLVSSQKTQDFSKIVFSIRFCFFAVENSKILSVVGEKNYEYIGDILTECIYGELESDPGVNNEIEMGPCQRFSKGIRLSKNVWSPCVV